jgi:hypothetical protein
MTLKPELSSQLVLLNNCMMILPGKEDADFRATIKFALRLQIKH